MKSRKGFQFRPKTVRGAVAFHFWMAFFRIFDALGIWRLITFFWKKIFPVRRLTENEIETAKMIFAENQLFFDKIRIHEHSPLCKWSDERAFVAFRIIHYPEKSETIDVLIHELAHVAQYEKVGARYAPEALAVQFQLGGVAYNFELFGKLSEQRARGGRFCDLNRESQAQLVQDYFLEKIVFKRRNRLAEMELFMTEMRAGDW
jgi:hypothetical protein